MGLLDISWGSKVDKSEIIYTPGEKTIPKTQYGIITDHIGNEYLVTDETLTEGDKYYHFIDGDGLIHTAGKCTLTLSYLNNLSDVYKLIKK
jgi:hypothetical protein